jgi:shikimate kinase
LALAGVAGAGTRTVGAEVAQRLGREFVDADRLVAERTGHDLAWLRTHRGVNEVRQIEANAIRRAANGRPTVVALDADSLGDATAVAEIRQLYRTVWLWASPARLPHAASVDLVVDGERPPGEIVDLLEFEIRHVEK